MQHKKRETIIKRVLLTDGTEARVVSSTQACWERQTDRETDRETDRTGWEGENKVVEAQRQEKQVCMWKVGASSPQTGRKRACREVCELHSPTPQQLPLRSLSAVCLTHSCPSGAVQWTTVEDVAPALNVTLHRAGKVQRAGLFPDTRACVFLLEDTQWMSLSPFPSVTSWSFMKTNGSQRCQL